MPTPHHIPHRHQTPAVRPQAPRATNSGSSQQATARNRTDVASVHDQQRPSSRTGVAPIASQTRATMNHPRTQQTRGPGTAGKGGVVSSRTNIPQQTNQGSSPNQKSNSAGIFFFLVLGLAIGKDVFDLVILLLDAVAVGLTATVVGSVIGIPLGIFSEALAKFVAFFVNATILVYFWFTGGKFALRLVVMSIGAIIEAVPVLNVLPLTAFTFVLAHFIGQAATKLGGSSAGRMATKLVGRTPVGRVAKVLITKKL